MHTRLYQDIGARLLGLKTACYTQSGFFVLGSWFLVLRSWFLVLGSEFWFCVQSSVSENPEPRTWNPERKRVWAASSAGRAPRSQCGGRGFDPRAVHQPSLPCNLAGASAGKAPFARRVSTVARWCGGGRGKPTFMKGAHRSA